MYIWALLVIEPLTASIFSFASIRVGVSRPGVARLRVHRLARGHDLLLQRVGGGPDLLDAVALQRLLHLLARTRCKGSGYDTADGSHEL